MHLPREIGAHVHRNGIDTRKRKPHCGKPLAQPLDQRFPVSTHEIVDAVHQHLDNARRLLKRDKQLLNSVTDLAFVVA